MGVKEKLGELVNIINTSGGTSSQLDEIVWDLLSEIDYTNLDYSSYYSSTIKLEYDDFINIWYNFIKKSILELPDDKLMDINFAPIKSSLKISLFEDEISQEIETLFNLHINSIDDDLLLFYIKGENKILLMYKSYKPLLDADEIRLPFWEYKLEHPGIKKKFENVFDSNDNLCILGYSI
jgi:hypothetical protein